MKFSSVMMKTQLITTQDGSSTLYLPDLDETYHSKFGAINESLHVFINNGLAQLSLSEINVFEVGFGTGLNTLLSVFYAQQNQLKINYTSIEKFPLPEEVTSSLNYNQQINNSLEIFNQIHQSAWNTWSEISKGFRLKKIQDDILNPDFEFPSDIDLIYFDAFAPSKQAELWNEQLFIKLYQCLATNGRLVTYSAAGIVKQALRNSGFKVKRLPGPAGKHHMLTAIKTTD